jgi:hypothetical protein
MMLGVLSRGVAARPIVAPVSVAVSSLPQKYFVERVGGAQVEVSVTRAQVYLRIGVPFEQVWMTRLVDANPRMRVDDLNRAREAPHGFPPPTPPGIRVRTMAVR